MSSVAGRKSLEIDDKGEKKKGGSYSERGKRKRRCWDVKNELSSQALKKLGIEVK
jgi:hypothetical protein